MNALGVIAVSTPSVAIVILCIWIFVKHGGKCGAGTYAIMYVLFFSSGWFFGGGPDTIEVAKDPEWKKRPENADPPIT